MDGPLEYRSRALRVGVAPSSCSSLVDGEGHSPGSFSLFYDALFVHVLGNLIQFWHLLSKLPPEAAHPTAWIFKHSLCTPAVHSYCVELTPGPSAVLPLSQNCLHFFFFLNYVDGQASV